MFLFLENLLTNLVTLKCILWEWASPVAQLVKILSAMQETWVLVPGLGRSPGEGKGYPIQYSGLENSMHSPWGRKKSDRDGSDKIFLLLVLILSS